MGHAPSVEIRPDLVDRMIDSYCDWRTGCAEVHAAYDRFCRAAPGDRALAFAAFAAALDREQCACESYAAHVRLLQALCAEIDQARREQP